MSIEEEAHFADILVAEALRRGGGALSPDDLAAAYEELATSASVGQGDPRWEVSVAVVRLTLEIYMSGESDETIEGCLAEAVRVIGDSIRDQRRAEG